MINNVVLVGRLTRAVDLRYTSNGTAYATFTVAVERRFKNQNGERETDFINCVISLLESRNVTEQRPANDQSSHGGFQQNQTNNFNQFNTPTSSFGGGASDPFLSNGETINISDDDLPF